MSTMIRSITNGIYGVSRKIKQFEKDNPTILVLAAGATKARIVNNDDDPKYDYGWAVARRSTLLLTTDGLHCGDWFIPLSDIQNATFFRITRGAVLSVMTNDERQYQFGLSYDSAWVDQAVLPITVENTELKYSLMSLLMRVFVIGLSIWFVVRDFSQHQVGLSTVMYLFLIIWFVSPLLKKQKIIWNG